MDYINLVQNNLLIRIVIIAVMLDTFLGVCRALKEKKFNSCFGIDGGIRKVAMLGCIAFLALLDMCIKVNLAFMIPESWLGLLGVNRIGICEFFCILFILYEAISILKNLSLCGLPISKKWINKLQGFLRIMTDEMPDTSKINKTE